MIWKIGDKVKLKGTKTAGLKEWDNYFGNFGIVKGDLVTIISSYDDGYFVKTDKHRPWNSGRLSENDLEKPNNSLRGLIE